MHGKTPYEYNMLHQKQFLAFHKKPITIKAKIILHTRELHLNGSLYMEALNCQSFFILLT